jgi:hypothetical protein
MRIPIIAGIRVYGRHNDGAGWAGTRFLHFWGIPLIPLGGVRGRHDDDVPTDKAGLSLFSIALGWFQVQGFFFALFLALAAGKSLANTDVAAHWPASAAIVVPVCFFPVLLMTLVVASWFCAYRPPGEPMRRRIGTMLGTMLVFVGAAAALSTLPMLDAMADRRREEDARHAEEANERARLEEQDAAREKTRKELHVLAAVHAGLRPESLGKCNDEVLAKISDEVIALRTVEGRYLASASSSIEGAPNAPLPREESWLVTESLRVAESEARFGEAALTAFGGARFLAVVHHDTLAKKPVSFLSIHERTTGKVTCGARIEPKPTKKGDVAAERAAFVDAMRVALGKISARFELVLASPSS